METANSNELQGEAATDDQFDDVSVASMQPVLSTEGTNGVASETHDDIDPVLGRYREACQNGDLSTVKQIIESELIDVNNDLDDKEHVSGLHWAAVNNRLSVVEYLISKGADVNLQAGKLHATALHWAASFGYVHIVDFLLDKGADPTITDDQGFNLLHLAINSSNILLVLYVLFFVVSRGKLDIDCTDPNGRTPLLWAAYQGDSLTVHALLRFGANTKLTDSGGFTPLHWGTVKGQPHVLKYLIHEGSDYFAKTNDGKDCFVIAQEMNTQYALKDALAHSGFNSEGYPVKKLFRTDFQSKAATFFTPFLLLGIAFVLLGHIHPLFALIVILLLSLASIKALKKYVIPGYTVQSVQDNTILRSPFLAGILVGSVLWLGVVWVTRILPHTFLKKWLAHITLFICLTSFSYHFFKLLTSDPGCIPSETDHETIRATIKSLLQLGLYDTDHFCLETWVRKPLRSKFSYLNAGLVSRFDHYCPWVYNDIGLINHKRFILFIISIEVGIFSFASVCMSYFDYLEDINKEVSCFLLGDDELCAGMSYDRFVFVVMVWSIFQSIWVGFLIVVQFFQTSKGLTSYEFNKLIKESKENKRQNNTTSSFNTAPSEFSDENDTRDILLETANNNPRTTRTYAGLLCAVLGLDQLLAIARDTIGSHTREQYRRIRISSFIPTNYGWKTNFRDFWLTSDATAPTWQRLLYSAQGSKALLNGAEVDYYKLYSLPSSDEIV